MHRPAYPPCCLHGDLAQLADAPGLQQKVERLLTLKEEPFVAGLAWESAAEKVITHSSQLRNAICPFLTLWRRPRTAFQVDAQVDLFCAMAARAALEGIRPPPDGFFSPAASNTSAAIFLRGLSTVRCLPDRIEINLPRSPLSLVLQLSGLLAANLPRTLAPGKGSMAASTPGLIPTASVSVAPFLSGIDHLLAELERIALLLHVEVLRLRASKLPQRKSVSRPLHSR